MKLRYPSGVVVDARLDGAREFYLPLGSGPFRCASPRILHAGDPGETFELPPGACDRLRLVHATAAEREQLAACGFLFENFDPR